MAIHRPETIAKRARERIVRIRRAIMRIELVCSGTLLERMKMCGRPGCACASNPAARHGPYFEWGYLREGRLRHRQVQPPQAAAVRQAIVNYREVKKLLRDWEAETEKLIDAKYATKG